MGVHDLIRSIKTRLTFDERDEVRPTWSPSGQEIGYRTSGLGIARKAADGTGEAIQVVEAPGVWQFDWTPDRTMLLLVADEDIFTYRPGADEAPVALVDGPFDEDVIAIADRDAGLASALGSRSLEIMGPAPLPLARLRRRCRWHVTLRGPSRAAVHPVARQIVQELKAAGLPGRARVNLDADPVHLL